MESLKRSKSRNGILELLISYVNLINAFILSTHSTKKFKENLPCPIPNDKKVINKPLVEGKMLSIQLNNVPFMIIHKCVSGCNSKGSTQSDSERLTIYVTAKT